MKKQIALALLASIFLGMAGTTQAGSSNHGYRNNHSGGYDRNYYSHGRGYNDRSYRGGKHHRGGHGSDHFGRGLAIVAGAVVLGSVISAINHNASRRDDYRYGPAVRGQDYWYRIDENGECVEVRLNQQGREVWTHADPSYCY